MIGQPLDFSLTASTQSNVASSWEVSVAIDSNIRNIIRMELMILLTDISNLKKPYEFTMQDLDMYSDILFARILLLLRQRGNEFNNKEGE